MFYYSIVLLIFAVSVLNWIECVPYRLPKDIKPVRYILTIEPHLKGISYGPTYNGSVVIEIKAVNITRNIVLHADNELFIDKSSINVTESTGTTLNILETFTDGEAETYTITLKDELSEGERYNLTISNFYKDLEYRRGFLYAHHLLRNGTQSIIAATHFEPSTARSTFPCFDEPALKATFIIHLIRDQEYTSLSNEELETTKDLGNGKFKDMFKETPPMSTFLVAFAISDFKAIAKERHRIFGRPDSVESGDFTHALDVSFQTLQILEEFTGINLTVSKMDLFAVPDAYYPYQAMENWGLIMYQEKHLSYTNQSSLQDLKRITCYIAHELSHQWFGDLVTPEWWDYVWLSESFAQYFEYYIASIVKPTWRLMDQFVIDVVHQSLLNEEFGAAGPLNYQVEYSSELPPSVIMYEKGGCIVRMMSHFLRQDIFQKGLQVYLQNRQFSTAVPSDLYSALQEAVNKAGTNDLLGNLTVADILETWDSVPGFPVVTVTRNYSTGSITIKQSNKFSDVHTIWNIPISYVFSSDGKLDFSKTTADFWLSEENVTVNDNFPTSGWLLVNKQQMGYYRVNYDLENWERIIQHLKSEKFESIHVLNRAQLISDAFYFAFHNELPVDTALNLCEYLAQEKDYIPFMAFGAGFSGHLNIPKKHIVQQATDYFLKHRSNNIISVDDDELPNEYVKTVLSGVLEDLKSTGKPNDSFMDKLYRKLVAQKYFPRYLQIF